MYHQIAAMLDIPNGKYNLLKKSEFLLFNASSHLIVNDYFRVI